MKATKGKITHTTAKYVLEEMFRTGKNALEIVNEQDLWEIGTVPEVEDESSQIHGD